MPAQPEAVRAIIESRHGQPFAVLGPHEEQAAGGKKTMTVRTFHWAWNDTP